jgi:FKBP-type peptidyl-prolyl cis-trans isomerase
LFVLSGLLSCQKEDPVEKQEEKIEMYISSKMNRNHGLILSKNNGVYYLYAPGDTAIKVSRGDSIYFYYAGTLLADTLRYFDTNDKTLVDAKLNTEHRTFEPLGVIAGNNNLLTGLNTGLNMVHLYDKGEIIFNSDMGFEDKGNGIIPPFSPLIFKVNIIRIKKN